MMRRRRRSGLSNKQIIGVILIIAGIIPFIPFIKGLDWIAALVTLVVGLYLLLK
jgi:VIT1/CCC1 family predicted Fe2+/Mn2+ transporter